MKKLLTSQIVAPDDLTRFRRVISGDMLEVFVQDAATRVLIIEVYEEVPDTVPVWQYVIKMPWQAPYVSPKHYPEGGCEAVYPGAEWVLRLDQTEKQVPA